MSGELLADRLYRSVAGAIGSGEHLQIAGLLREATRTVIDRDAASEVRKWLDGDPWAFECNLDVLTPPLSPEWIEWPLETRSGHGGGDEAVTGCLVAPHPDDPGLVTFVTGWASAPGPARHSYAVAMADLGHLYELAWGARQKFSRVPEESIERIMSCVTVSMPRGFEDEIGILVDGFPGAAETAMKAAMRDATAEIPFVMALVVAMRSRGGLLVSNEDGHCRASLREPLKRSAASRAAAWLIGRNPAGFSRKLRRGIAEVSWYR